MSVLRATEGIGLVGLTVGVMTLFGVVSLAIIFMYHGALASIYSISRYTRIPFLVVLAFPFWGGFIAACTVNGVRWLLKHVSRS